MTDRDLLSRQEIARSPYYQELLFDHGYGLFIGAAALNRPHEKALMGIHFPRGSDPYTAAHFERYRLLLPHFRRAVRLQHRFAASVARGDQLTAAIDALPHGIVVLDNRGRVAHLNRAAERMLTRERGLVVANRQVMALDAGIQRDLARMVGAAVCPERALRDTADAVVVWGAEPDDRLWLYACPLPSRMQRERAQGAVLAIVDMRSGLPGNAVELLRSVYGMTPAEAKLSLAVAQGENLAGYAAKTRISVETARVHLKRAMHKIGVTRQAELVGSILTSIGSLPH